MKKVVVYTMEYCPFCEAAKRLLKRRGIEYSEIKLSGNGSDWDDLEKRTGLKTAPQIFADDELIGGYDDLARLDGKDQLQSLKL